MLKFVFVVPPLTGHINPTLSVGARLLELGHQVAWISIDAALAAQLPAGGELLLLAYDTTDAQKQEGSDYLHAISRKQVYGIESIKFLYEEVLVPLNRFMYEGIVDLLKSYRPDVVINDHQLFAAAVAAVQLGIPYATSVTAPAAIKMREDLPMVHQWETQQMVALQQELGLAGDASVVCSELLTLVFTSRAFFGDMELPEQYRFVGPVIQNRPAVTGFDWEAFAARTYKQCILVTIGTTFSHEHKKAFFEKVTEALQDEPVTVLVVSDPALFAEWPQNFIVQTRLPQLELLPVLDGVVCHGGHNTVCETLLHGLPLVVIPIAYDQSYVASRVGQVQAGVRLNFKRFYAKHLKEAVHEILHKNNYTVAAQRIKASFEQAGGTAAAAQLLLRLATEGVLQALPVTETLLPEYLVTEVQQKRLTAEVQPECRAAEIQQEHNKTLHTAQ